MCGQFECLRNSSIISCLLRIGDVRTLCILDSRKKPCKIEGSRMCERLLPPVRHVRSCAIRDQPLSKSPHSGVVLMTMRQSDRSLPLYWTPIETIRSPGSLTREKSSSFADPARSSDASIQTAPSASPSPVGGNAILVAMRPFTRSPT
jgi:hypothetical protein